MRLKYKKKYNITKTSQTKTPNTEFNKAAFTMIPNVSVKEEKTNISTAQAGMLHISPIMAGVSPIKLSVSGQVVENKKDDIVSFQYDEAYGEGTYLSVEPQLNGVNQKIVLSRTEDVSNISFTIISENCTPVIQEDGCIQLVNNESKQVTQVIETPVISTEDLESDFVIGDVFGRGSYTLNENEDGSHSLGITIPEEMNMDISEYGDLVVTVPVVAATNATGTTTGQISPALDTGIYTGTPSTCYNNEVLSCFGRDSGYGYGRALTHFTKPAAITLGATIHYAFFWARECTGETSSTYVQPYIVNDTWNSQTTWSTRPGFMSTTTMTRKNINSASTDMSGNPYWYKFSIYQAVNAWVKGVKVYRGIIFRSEEEINQNYRWRAFATKEYTTSSMRPYTVINYTNDTTAPTLESVTKSPTGWTNGNVTLTVNGAEDEGAGLHAAAYSFSTTPGSYTWQVSNQKTFSSNGTVYIYLRDKLENDALRQTVAINNIDKLKPAVPSATVSQSNWSQSPVSITVQADDTAATTSNGKSGVKYYSCTTIPGQYDWKTVATPNSAYTFTNMGHGNYYVYAKDQANNISAVATATARVDLENPEVNSVHVETNASNNASTVHIEASDDTSGINAYSLDGGENWTAVSPSTKNLETDVNTSLNSESIDVRVKDLSGRVSDGTIVPLAKPEFYDYNGLVGIFNPNLNGESIEYRFEGDEDWTTYEKPIELEETQTIYAKFANGSNAIYNQFTPLETHSGVYTDSETDLTITNNNLSFDVTREYNSDDNDWHFSTESFATLTHDDNIVEVTMPDHSKMCFIKNAENSYIDENTGYTLSETSTAFIISADDEIYQYNKSTGRLASILDSFEHQIIFDYNLSDELIGITAVAGTNEHQYTVSEVDGKIRHITTPITDSNNVHEKLVYQYTTDGLVKVYYDKDTLQFKRSDDIIKNEYGYSNNKLTFADGNTVNYENGVYTSITTPAGETIARETESESDESESVSAIEPEVSYTYFEGTNIVQTETTVEVEENTTTTTVNTFNISSQLISSSQTQTKTNGAGGTDEVYSRNVVYTYFENTDTIHTETVTETVDSTASTTVTTYDIQSNIVAEAATENGKTTETAYTYDVWGNVLTSVTTLTENSLPAPVSSTAFVYDALNRCVKETVSEPNSDPVVTYKAYNPLDDVIYEKTGSDVARTLYDKYGRTVQEIEPLDYSASADGLSLSGDTLSGNDTYSDSSSGHRYVYDESTRLLTSETNRLGIETTYTYHNNSSVVETESFDIYRYKYSPEGNLTEIFVANTIPAYAQYLYDSNNNNTEIRYGNGQTIYYVYSNGKVTSQKYKSNSLSQIITLFTYDYNTDNELLSKTDCINHRRTDYNCNTVSVYDTSGDSDMLLYSYSNTEKDSTTNTPKAEQKNYAGNSISVTYEENSNLYKLNNNDVFSVNNTYNDNWLTSTVVNNSSNQSVVSKSYTFDDDNNIIGLNVNNTQISYVYNNDLITEYHQGNNAAYYHYDNKNQLIREDIYYSNYQRTITYTYDRRGNLTQKVEYPYTRTDNLGQPLESNDLEFEYEDELWIDEIVETPTETILYDENGNPVNLEDCTFEWTNGRQLKSVSSGSEVILEYTYDDDGIRTSKTYQGETTYYITENGIITSQYQLDSSRNKINEVIFIYDNGTLISAYYNNIMYYYLTNVMGDVISIIDENGNTVVDYCYDAWGNVVDKVSNTILPTDFADVNPMLYRSYYWDEDLCVYYLQSRYFKSDWCRFINADLPMFAKIQKSLFNGLNLFTYCCNNPVKYEDYTGNFMLLAVAIALRESLSVRMYKWGLTHFGSYQYYDFSLYSIGTLVKRRLKNSPSVNRIINSLIKKIKNKKVGTEKTYKGVLCVYDEKRTFNNLDIMYSTGDIKKIIIVVRKIKKYKKKNKYQVEIGIPGEYYNFEKWSDSKRNKFTKFVNNNVGYYSQEKEYFYPYIWGIHFSYKVKR